MISYSQPLGAIERKVQAKAIFLFFNRLERRMQAKVVFYVQPLGAIERRMQAKVIV